VGCKPCSAIGAGGGNRAHDVLLGAAAATLTSIFVQVRWPYGVDYLALAGRAISDDRFVRERIVP
jgi:hypothetical protein